MNTDKIIAEKIASEYAQKEISQVTVLKRLDARAKFPAIIFTYSFGIIMTLLLGVGMCLSLGEIGDRGIVTMSIGIIVGIIGIAGISVNYFIYKKLLKFGKKRYAPTILALAKRIAEED